METITVIIEYSSTGHYRWLTVNDIRKCLEESFHERFKVEEIKEIDSEGTR